MIPRVVLVLLFVSGSLLGHLAQDSASGTPVAGAEADGSVLFGVNADWPQRSITDVRDELGVAPAAYGTFVPFPMDDEARTVLQGQIDEIAANDGIAILIVEPIIALNDVTAQHATDLADQVASYNAQGVTVLLVFGQEMNGSWHAWGQQPVAYVDAFRLVAEAIHSTAPDTSMVWSPNYGGGYIFDGASADEPLPDFDILDTNGDGVLDGADDPYSPYYPGDDVVDWVGMTLFHWGGAHPWGENEVPEAGKFVGQLRGSWVGANGDESYLPDFYDTYVARPGKPLMVLTSALYNETLGTGPHVEIKQEWWRQVVAARNELPGFQLVQWFEWRKEAPEVDNALVDWTLTHDGDVLRTFQEDVPGLNIRLAGEE